MTRWAVLAAAGAGSRYGRAKQFDELGGRSLVDIAVDLFKGWDGVVAVVPDERRISGAVSVTGGATRRESVARGLAAVPAAAEVIAVHDAARPWAAPALVEALLAALDAAEGAIPGRRVTDTVKRVDGLGVVLQTVPRDELRTVQTPQIFRAGALRRAHAEVPSSHPAPDDASLVEALGLSVVVVDWAEDNPKVTWPGDLPPAAERRAPR